MIDLCVCVCRLIAHWTSIMESPSKVCIQREFTMQIMLGVNEKPEAGVEIFCVNHMVCLHRTKYCSDTKSQNLLQ